VYVATVVNSKRIPQVSKDLSTMGVTDYEFNYQVPPAVKNFVNITLSCTDNHLQIYRKALERRFPYICVFEDDVYIPPSHLPRVREVLSRVKQFIQSDDWDLIYLGNFPWKIGAEKGRGIHEGVFWCTHAYIISERGMRYMLKYSPEEMMKIGRTAVPSSFDMVFREGGGIDTFLAYSSVRNRLKSYAVVPMLVEQSSIPKWAIKARLAERASKGEWWTLRLFHIVWVLYWLVLLAIIYVLRKKSTLP
jgi:GR25 family glycosyltransferase involved in LPS biosynthesis